METQTHLMARVSRRLRQYFVAYPVRRKPSNIYGLKYIPTIEPTYSDDNDFIFGWRKTVEQEVTERNVAKMREIFLAKRDTCQCIFEIGVCRNAEGSFTHVFLNHKRDETIFFGVDIDDKSFLDDPASNIFTVRANSHQQELVRGKLRELGNPKVDLLFIDGWHSVNTMVNDWKYADLLADDGAVVIHDTNCHPGPVCVFDAVDERLFLKQKFFTREADWGMAVCRKIRSCENS